MGGLLVSTNGVKGATKGLDFFHPALLGIKAVGPASHHQISTVAPLERHLSLIGGASSCGDACMAFPALLCGGCGAKAQIQISAARGEFAKCSHSNRIRHEAHRT